MQDFDKALRLSASDQACVAQALLAPPMPSPALVHAFANRQCRLVAQADRADMAIQQFMDEALADVDGSTE